MQYTCIILKVYFKAIFFGKGVYMCFPGKDLMDQQMVAGSECKDRACSNVGGISCKNHVVTKNNIE